MTETSTTPAPDPADAAVTDTALEPAGAAQEPVADQPDTEAHRARQEAQKLRQRLRDAEAERDASTATLNALRESEVLRIAGQSMADGSDLLALGNVAVADLLGDDGRPDPGKIQVAIDALLSDKPHLATRPAPKPTRPVESLQPGSGAAPGTAVVERPNWGQVLRGH